MKNITGIFKILVLDWVITIVMYLSGLVISSLESSKKADIISYLSEISPSMGGTSYSFDTFIYLFISISIVILISHLVNKSYLKVGKKEFITGQIFYILSFALVVFGAVLLI